MRTSFSALLCMLFLVGCTASVEQPAEEGSVACTDKQRLADFCTAEYKPVCGWDNENIQCFKYPCASTYSNSCEACKNEQVAYWTIGECPA